MTYQKLTGFMVSFYFILILLVSWDRFLLCHTPIRPILALRDQISILSTNLSINDEHQSPSFFFYIFIFIFLANILTNLVEIFLFSL
jgi:hypothetical protein